MAGLLGRPLRVTIWNEFVQEQSDPKVQAIYPAGIHAVVADALREQLADQVRTRLATLDQAEHGLTREVLDTTDVLVWWGHLAHDRVSDDVVNRVVSRVLRGMGLVVLHSGHFSKVFRRLMGTSCRLRWRDGNDRELVWTVKPSHPICRGVPTPIIIPQQEMYGEFFDIPTPDELVFVSSFSGGEVFRSGCCFYRGHGRVFYFSPGDQDYPVYHQPDIRRVLANGVVWATSDIGTLPEDYAPEYCPDHWFEPKTEAEPGEDDHGAHPVG